ncbi:MAG: hypothetical protein ACYCVL_11160 [Gemmatimonadaceae bacterium]
MRRLLLVLPFVLGACGDGSTLPSAPGAQAASAGAAHLNVANASSCTIYDKTYQRGFDANGYNQCADQFNGTGSSWCVAGGQAADCMGIYSLDKLEMKWNDAWDACNQFGTATQCAGAWLDNEWNGQFPGGSGQVWHYKIVWSAACTAGIPLTDGGYCVWGAYEVLMDQGIDPTQGPGHIWFALAKPNGYGG